MNVTGRFRGPDAFANERQSRNVKMREEEGVRGAREKHERGPVNASNEVSALLRRSGRTVVDR